MEPPDKRTSSGLSARWGQKPTKRPLQRLRTLPWLYIISFLLLALFIAGFIYQDLRAAYDSNLVYWKVRLSNSAEGQIRLLTLWLRERGTDAEVIAENPLTARLLPASEGKGSVTDARNLMERKLQAQEPGRGFLAGFIVDTACNIVARGGAQEVAAKDLQSACMWVYRTNGFVLGTSRLEKKRVWIYVAIPVLLKKGRPQSGQATQRLAGAVILVFEPWKYLYPFFASEADPAQTTETLVVWKQEGGVSVFSPGRGALGKDCLFQRRLDESTFEAEVARHGGQLFGEFADYRGVRVFGASKEIPFAGAELARKVDSDEALADYRRRVVLEGLAGTLAILLFGVVMVAQHRRAALHDLKEELQQQAALLDLQQQAAISEARYQDLFENANDCVVMYDLEGKIISLNKAAEKISGYTREEALKLDIFQILSPEDQGLFRESLGRLLAGEAAAVGEVDFIAKDGRRVPMDASAQLFHERGVPVGMQVFARDITERKRAEEALRDSERRYRTLFENANDAILIFELENEIILEANQKACESYGFPKQELVRMSLKDLTKDVSRGKWQIDEILRKGSHLNFETVHVNKDGSPIDILASSSVIDYGGQRAILAILRDVTERKRAEEALRESQERFRRLSEASFEGIAFSDCGTLIDVNPRLAEMLGYEQQELIGMEISHLVPPESRELVMSQIRSESEKPYENWIRRKDGSIFPVETQARYLPWMGKKIRVTAIRDITERKKAEEALQKEKAFTEAVIDSLPGAFYVVDTEGRLIRWNQNAKILGYSREELRALGPFGTLVDYERDAAAQKMKEALEKGSIIAEAHLLTKDGRKIPYLFTGVRAVLGDKVYIIGTGIDISQRKRVEEALRESEQRYRDFISHSHEGVWRVELEQPLPANLPVQEALERVFQYGYLAEANDAMARILGADRADEIVGKHLKDLVLATDEGRLALFRSAGGDWQSMTIEVEANDVGGSPRYLLRTQVPIIENGMLLRVWGFIRDITDLKQAEAERSRLMAAIEQATEGITFTDTQGNIEYVNPAFTVMTGYPREELIGKNPRILKSGEQDAAFYRNMWKILLAGQAWHGELINRRKDGSLYPEEMTITPVRSEHGEVTHYIAIKVDVTGRRHLEDQLRQAQKMEAVGRLAGGVAHDFNNMLQIINGYSELVLDQLQPEDSLRGHVQEIKNAVERAASLTRQLLAFSRQQVLAPKVLDLNAVIVNLNKMLRRLIGEDVDLVMIEGRGLGRVKADPGQIDQVIMNLAVNARDAMPDGGRLTIETANVQLNEDFTRGHFPMTPGPYVMLAVTDTGCGMDEETQTRLFEPFFTTKEKGKGTGLGLATVYGIIKQSGGYIWVQSEARRGSTFKIFFPPVEGTTDGEKEKAIAAVPGGSETVLLAEDEADVRSLVRRVLEARGYRVLEARNGEEALRVAKRHRGTIHMLITDVVMPEMGGRELVERLARQRKEMKVLFMSAYADDALRHPGEAALGATLLQKPFTADELANMVRKILEES